MPLKIRSPHSDGRRVCEASEWQTGRVFMQIIHEPREMQQLCAGWRCAGATLGFVPTMGALHDGHLALCKRARDENDRFVASIFVNPRQFGPREDLASYPKPFERDCQLLRDFGCDAVFAPSAGQMYGDSRQGTWVDVLPLSELWEGVTRPGHLRGVTTVVAKLLNICAPARAYFGEKDFQQLRAIESLVRDLNFSVQIVPCETLREPDGLAMSSRNAFLSEDERASAAIIFRALTAGESLARSGETDVTRIGAAMSRVLLLEPKVRPQYVAVVDAQTLAPLQKLDGRAARILIAAHLGKTRLIDNLAL